MKNICFLLLVFIQTLATDARTKVLISQENVHDSGLALARRLPAPKKKGKGKGKKGKNGGKNKKSSKQKDTTSAA